MALDFPFLVYEPCFDIFARQVTITPYASQPGVAGYLARGIFDTNPIEIIGQDGSLFSDTKTELDIFMPEFPVLPMQGDYVSIPDDQDIPGGVFEVIDVSDKGNAGGEVSLNLRRLVESKLVGYQYFLGSPDFARPALTLV